MDLEKIKTKKVIQQLPAEVIIDLSKEVTFLSNRDGDNNRSCYINIPDAVFLCDFDVEALTHETGHALDFMGAISTTKKSSIFKNAYKTELQAFIDAGNVQYEKNSISGYQNGSVENYATKNELEMFAECYTLLMTGNCTSKNCILTYFPKTLEAAKQHLNYIRAQDDKTRH